VNTDWASLSAEQLQAYAAEHFEDHNDGSSSFFKPEQGLWKLESIDPLQIHAFESRESACAWILEEIEFFNSIRNPRGQMYQTMIEKGISEPVIVGVAHAGAKLWDGYHRAAIAMVRGEPLRSVVGYADTLVASLTGETKRRTNMREVRLLSIGTYDIHSQTGSYHVKVDDKERSLHLSAIHTKTNANRLAIQGLIEGVKKLKEPSSITIITDRQIGLNNGKALNQDKVDELTTLLERGGHRYELVFNKGRGREVRNEIHNANPKLKNWHPTSESMTP
jgi:hypothetical protein